MTLTVARSVSNGVKWLDKHVPGWEDKINLTSLRMADTCRCVCGQVFRQDAKKSGHSNGYNYAQEEFEGQSRAHVGWAIYNGFDAYYDRGWDDFRDLQKEWKRVIKERQDALVAV